MDYQPAEVAGRIRASGDLPVSENQAVTGRGPWERNVAEGELAALLCPEPQTGRATMMKPHTEPGSWPGAVGSRRGTMGGRRESRGDKAQGPGACAWDSERPAPLSPVRGGCGVNTWASCPYRAKRPLYYAVIVEIFVSISEA